MTGAPSHDDGCADFYPEYGEPEGGVCKVCGDSTQQIDPAHTNGSTA